MARIQESVEPKAYTIDAFLGLNMPSAGDTQLIKGESGNMNNCYITKDYDLSKAMGYLQLTTQIASKPIQGMWYGDIGGKTYFLFAINGHLYKFNDDFWLDFDGTSIWGNATTDLGTLTDDKTEFFGFGGKVYILNGTEYKSYDGTNLIDVAGYVPKIYIGCSPTTGEGTQYELLNLLTGKKHCTYNTDGTATYKLPESAITSVDKVYVNGTLKTLTTHYTVDLSIGAITFTSGNVPASGGLDNADIYWTKGTGTRDTVVKNRYACLFGQATDTRVFLYGNKNDQNVRINSDLANGIPSAEYFTSANIDQIGSSSSPIISMGKVNNIMLTFKPNETYYASYDSTKIDGIDQVNFPTILINDARGCVAMGQYALLNNDLYTIDTQFIRWAPTTERNETNMSNIGKRIQRDLNEYDLSKCLMIDKQNSSECFISNGKKVWIYNYGHKFYRNNQNGTQNTEYGTFSRMTLEDEPTCWITINGDLFFGTTTGRIMRMSDDYLTFNGKAINSHWEMNMYDFGGSYLLKTLNKAWATFSAQPKVEASIQYVTEKNAYSIPYQVTYNLVTFDDVDFANFTFFTNYNPQTFYLRMKAQKFKYIKLVLDNTSATSTFKLMNITLLAEYGSEVK
jgi:hypothetical protein